MKFALAALALAIPAFAAGSAQAQTATFCQGRMAANAFYNTVQSNGRTSTVSYFMQLQNRTNTEIPRYTVLFNHHPAHNRQNGSSPKSLPAYQQVTVLLGVQSFNNPSGQGAMSPYDPASGVPHYTIVDCR